MHAERSRRPTVLAPRHQRSSRSGYSDRVGASGTHKTVSGPRVNFSLTESSRASEVERENAHAPDPDPHCSATPEDKSLAFPTGGEAAQPREEVGLISLQPHIQTRRLRDPALRTIAE